MAEKKTAEADPATDEYGRTIHQYVSTVLVVLPSSDYSEETFRYARSCLYNVHVHTRSVSREHGEMIRGRLQDEFLVDGDLAGETMDAYSGVLFVAGAGARALAEDADAVRLATEAHQAKKLVAAWGDSVAVLAKAGVVKGLRVTGSPDLAADLKRAGGKFTGVQVERSGHVVTGLDDTAGFRFGKALIEVVGI